MRFGPLVAPRCSSSKTLLPHTMEAGPLAEGRTLRHLQQLALRGRREYKHTTARGNDRESAIPEIDTVLDDRSFDLVS